MSSVQVRSLTSATNSGRTQCTRLSTSGVEAAGTRRRHVERHRADGKRLQPSPQPLQLRLLDAGAGAAHRARRGHQLFWRDVHDLLFGSLSALGRRDFSDRSLKLAFGIAIGTIPIGIAGLALAKLLNTCTSPIRGLEVVGIACIVMALLLGLAELIARHQRSFERVGLLDCLVVGIAQVGALIPGVSRSGSTLTAALFLGFKREEAARFTFLVGLPAIALAGLKELQVRRWTPRWREEERKLDRAMSIWVLRAFSSLPAIEVDDDDYVIIGATVRVMRVERPPPSPVTH